MKFQVVNLGCKVNRVESDDVAACFLSQGLEPASSHDADVVFVNTCTVTGEADKKARKAVRHALNSHPNARVVVSGCASAIDPGKFQEMDPTRVDVIGRAELAGFVQDIVAKSTTTNLELANIKSDDADRLRIGEGFNTRVNIKVQDGCDNACTYCIVHVARGKATSRNFSEVVSECVRYAQNGSREIVLAGINLGSYNHEGRTLPELLNELLSKTADLPDAASPVRFRISSIEPECIDDKLLRVIATANGRICRHLHLPLQAGSSKVLREMARRYSADQFKQLVDTIYRFVPTMSLSTDIIVGFPGETEEDFQATYDLIEKVGYHQVFTFIYSKREGTPAASIVDNTPKEVIQDRFDRLVDLVQKQAYEANQIEKGRVVPVLVEGFSKRDPSLLVGKSPKNQTVHAPIPEGLSIEALTGSIIDVKINEAKTWYLKGEVC